jgi:hypothetical protein
MVSAEVKAGPREDWILANPWPYALIGFTSSLLALALTRLLPEDDPSRWDVLRGFLIVLGLGAGGSALTLRLNSARPAFVDELGANFRGRVLLGLGALFGLMAVGLTVILIAAIVRASWVPWRPGSAIVVWCVVAPISLLACRSCLQVRRSGTVLPWGHEAACLLVLFGLSAVAACWSLYFGRERADDWLTMRLFLSVLGFAAFVAAPFFLLSQTLRRIGLSVVFLLHFGGIATAALAAEPFPWIIGQLWMRIYRPYLEFMYLNNAYHFYAPEPGPSSLMWFRLVYEDKQGRAHGIWFKIPDLDDDGWHRHTVALEYQRFLSLTENIAQGTPTSGVLFNDSLNPLVNKDYDGILTYRMLEHTKKRWRRSEQFIHFTRWKTAIEKALKEGKAEILGKNPEDLEKVALRLDLDTSVINPIDNPNVVPFNNMVSWQQQYAAPRDLGVQRLVVSYVRHVAGRHHPEQKPDWTLKKIKVYRVTHVILPQEELVRGADPRDPIYYQPFFMGDYDTAGKLLNPDGSLAELHPDKVDPMLFWMLPVLRADLADPRSLTLSFALRHAGDDKWASRVDEDGVRRWFTPNRGMFLAPKDKAK